MSSLKDFQINKNNFKEYVDLLLQFGVRVENIVNFTQLIQRVGVDYNGFSDFIIAIMSMGVYVDDFVPFLCYLYSFGVVYDKASPKNKNDPCNFFTFLKIMKSYNLTYTNANDGRKKFMNAIDNFVYILSYGKEKVNCTSERILASMSIDNMNKTTSIIDTGKNASTQPKYCKYLIEPEPSNFNRTHPIAVSLTRLMDKVRELDPNLNDFANLNRFAAKGELGFNSDADTVIVNGASTFTLNLMDPKTKIMPNEELLRVSFQNYTRIFYNSSTELTNNDTPPLDVRTLTTFMTDNDGLDEFKNLVEKLSLPTDVMDKVVDRMISYNIANNGKKDTQNAYNSMNTTINTTKLFPYFSIAFIRKYIAKSPDMGIPKDDKVNSAKNPLNIRCEPYNKAGYNIQKCSDTFTTMKRGSGCGGAPQYSEISTTSQIWQSPLSSSVQPVQIAGHSPLANLTILNPSSYVTANTSKNYTPANW